MALGAMLTHPAYTLSTSLFSACSLTRTPDHHFHKSWLRTSQSLTYDHSLSSTVLQRGFWPEQETGSGKSSVEYKPPAPFM